METPAIGITFTELVEEDERISACFRARMRYTLDEWNPMNTDKTRHQHTPAEERKIREAALDRTLEETFPASDPLSTDPNPDNHAALDRETLRDDVEPFDTSRPSGEVPAGPATRRATRRPG